MNRITKFFIRKFFNSFYKIKPPEMVQYWKKNDSARAKVGIDKEGTLKMYIEGEKYAYPGFPRGHVLTGPLAKLKTKVKNRVFNEVFAELEKMAQDSNADMLPPERMSPAVRELNRVLEELENAEVVPDMKGRIKLIRKVICFFLQEDDAYRFRFQWALPRLNMKKIKLTKEDKYYFRGKYFKVDHDKFEY
ncbi:MAG: hypothetical protein CL489_03435 [Acidobacteria bacterium]|nr:hypothetical protein [Acidobacteriota bacterium]